MLLVEPAAIQHLQALLLGSEALMHQFGLAIAPDLNLSAEALAFSLKHLVEGKVWPRWWTHLAPHQRSNYGEFFGLCLTDLPALRIFTPGPSHDPPGHYRLSHAIPPSPLSPLRDYSTDKR